MQSAWLELVRIAGIRGQSCFHHFGLTTIIKFDPVCVALVSVIGVTGLNVSITDIALAGSNYLIFQLHFCSVTFFAPEKQIHTLDTPYQMLSQNLNDYTFLSKSVRSDKGWLLSDFNFSIIQNYLCDFSTFNWKQAIELIYMIVYTIQ